MRLGLPGRRCCADALIPLVAVIIAIGATVLIMRLQTDLNHSQRAQVAVQQLHTSVADLELFEVRLLEQRSFTASDARMAAATVHGMETDVRSLAAIHEAPAVVAAFERFVLAYKAMVAAVGQRDASRILAQYHLVYVPARDRLHRLLEPAAEIENGEALAAGRRMEHWTIATVTSAVLLTALLAWRVTRIRRRETETAEASSGELRERNEELRRAQRVLARTERSYRLLVEGLPGVTWIGDAETRRLRYVSPRSLDVLGYTPEELLASEDAFALLLAPKDFERAGGEIGRFLAHPGDQHHELRFVRKDGRVIWVDFHVTPVPNDDGGVPYAQCYIRDVTPLKDAAALQGAALAAEQAANERLRELDRSKDEFIAMVSHEFRTPLTSILGYLELVRDGERAKLDEEDAEFLGVVARNAERLERLVDDLLFMARLGAEKLVLEKVETDIGRLALEAVGAARPRAESGDVEIACSIDGLALVDGDAGRLAQLLDNLVSNAVKFTPPGGHVTVAVAACDDDVTITVTDTGIGMSAEDRKHLFEKFFRTEAADRNAIQGTGLGLVITKAIVDAHGGRIDGESEEGVGTTFRVVLPAATRRLDAVAA